MSDMPRARSGPEPRAAMRQLGRPPAAHCLSTQKNGSSTAIEEPAPSSRRQLGYQDLTLRCLRLANCPTTYLLVLLVPQSLGVDRLAGVPLQEVVGKAE